MGGGKSGGGGGNAGKTPRLSGVQVQTSAYGGTLAIGFGKCRMPPNLIWYGNFKPHAHDNSSGGKGGLGGGKGGSGNVTYTYTAAVMMGLCEGPIKGIDRVWTSKTPTTLAKTKLTLFLGTYPQDVWGFLDTNYPDQADPYNGVAHLDNSRFDLGSTAQLPNHNFEVEAFGCGEFVTGIDDTAASFVAYQMLTNVHYGSGFPFLRLGSFNDWKTYNGAAGLWVSPLYKEQRSAGDILSELAELTNVEFVWSSGVLNAVPYGDTNLSANGFSYTAPTVPLYDLDDDCFVADENSPPVQINRKRSADQTNNLKMEILDRSNQYDPSVVEFNDQANIDVYGPRRDNITAHMFCDMVAGRTAVQLIGQRKAKRNMYNFTVDPRFVDIDPMDIVTVTDPKQDLDHQWVRVKDVKERDDGCFDIEAEEYLNGTAHAAQYSYGQGDGFISDYNVDPGNVNAPVVFEPPIELLNGTTIEIWCAVSGGSDYGGCEVWVSYDDASYSRVGTIYGSARQGVLSAPFSSGANPDESNVLSIDVSMSEATLLSGTVLDAQNLATLCYVDGELIAYATATLTGTNAYDLSYLVRGIYHTANANHAVDSQFARLDQAIGKIPVELSSIGQTVYLKFLAFNPFQAGYQELSTLSPYAYTISGSALTEPLANPTNLTSNFVAGLTEIRWDTIPPDIRTPIDYEIRRGLSFGNSQVMGRTPLPKFTAYGNGTYWVSAHYQTPTGIDVYSDSPTAVTIVGSVLEENVVQTYDESALAFPGTFTDGLAAVFEGGQWELKLGGSGDILGVADILTMVDVLYFGGVAASGTYTPGAAQRVTLPYVAGCLVVMDWDVVGQSIFDDILTVTDVLSLTDVLGSEFASLVAARPQVRLSQDGTNFDAWRFYNPGQYEFMAIEWQLVVYSMDTQVTARVLSWDISVQVPDRWEKFSNLASAPGGTTQAFSAPFHASPHVQATVLNPSTGDDPPSLSWDENGFTIQCKNGGVGVSRNVNVIAQGY